MDDITPSSSHGPNPHGRIDNFAVLGKTYGKKLLRKLRKPHVDLLDAWNEERDPAVLRSVINTKRDNTADKGLTHIARSVRELGPPELRHLTRARALNLGVTILQSFEVQTSGGKTITARSTEAWPTSGWDRRKRTRRTAPH